MPEDLQKESMGRAFHAKGGRSGWWRRLSYDLPSPTLVTMPNHSSTALCHPEEIRALSVREYCKIQGFPDNWKVKGTPVQQYMQIGNAVPVRLGKIAGEIIVKYLEEKERNDWQISQSQTVPFRKIYIQSHVRTRQWFKNGKPCQWKDGKDNGDVEYAPPKTIRSYKIVGL